MKEYFTERCNIEDENDIIQYYVAFGWNYEGSQEVFNEHQEADPVGDTIYFKTITNHYMSIKFSRDMEMPYYDDLKHLQNNTINLIYSNSDLAKSKKAKKKKIGLSFGFSIFCLIFGIYLLADYKSTSEPNENIALGVISLVVGVILIFVGIILFKGRKKIEQNILDNQTKIAMNFSKAEELLKNKE